MVDTAELAKKLKFNYTPEVQEAIKEIEQKLVDKKKGEARNVLMDLRNDLLQQQPDNSATDSLNSLITTRQRTLLQES